MAILCVKDGSRWQTSRLWLRWQKRESILRSLGQSREKAELEFLAIPGEGLARRKAWHVEFTETRTGALEGTRPSSGNDHLSRFAKELEVQPPNTIHQVADALEVLMREDHATGAPFLAALVVSKVRNGLPAPAFFYVARMLGRFKDSDTQTYHARELESAWDNWGSLHNR